MLHASLPRWLVTLSVAPALGLALVTLIGCGNNQPVTAKNSGLRPAGEGDPASPAPGGTTPTTPQPVGAPDPDPMPAAPVTPTPPPAVDPVLPADEPPVEPDLTKVPDGTPKELMDYITTIERRLAAIVRRIEQDAEAEGDTAQILALKQAQIAAADKILADKDPGEYRTTAVSVKLSGLQMLAKLGNAPAKLAAQKFAEELSQDADTQIAQQGQLALLRDRIDSYKELAGGDEEEGDSDKPLSPEAVAAGDAIVADVDKMLADPEVGDEGFFVSLDAFGALLQTDRIGDGIAILEKLIAKYGDSKTDRIAFQVKQFVEQMPFILLMSGADGDKTHIPQAVAKLEAGLADKSLKIQNLQQALLMLEVGGHLEEVRKLIVATRAAYKDHPSMKLAGQVDRLCGNIEKRLDLIGKPLPIEGVLAGANTKFDWKPYEGKVVLIDFWATWCGPCLAEMPNIYRNYQKYHAQGFEVIGINMDEESEALDRFHAVVGRIIPGADRLPWATVVQPDLANAGMEKDPNAVRVGVDGIPCLLLIGRDGNVITLQPRGKRLAKVLAGLFPDKPAAEPAAPTPEEPAPPAESKTGAVRRNNATTFVAFADDPAEEKPAAEGKELDLSEVNPYSPEPDLTVPQLVDFILTMQDKPRTIQMRPGFREAIIEAADRIVAAKANGKPLEIARTAQFEYLHRDASLGDEKADAALAALAEACQGESNPRVARYVQLVAIEREALAADKLDQEKLPDLLAKIKAFCEQEKKLTAEHLRLASLTVSTINLLPEADRQARFEEFGKVFATSTNKQLSRYGKKLAAKPEAGQGQSDLVGKPLELKGQAVDGANFNWDTYRGKFVVVDFWATWCGPCRRAMPHLKEMYEKYKGKGVDVVGVSLDEDTDALTEYLEENEIAWTTLNGEESSDVAKKYGVRGIPTMMLIGKDGTILAVSHSHADIEAALEKALTAPVAVPVPAEKPKG